MGLGNLFSFGIQTTFPVPVCTGYVAGLRMEQVKARWDFSAKVFPDHRFR